MKLCYLLKNRLKLSIAIVIILISQNILEAQAQEINPILKAFENYTSAYREVAYVHLNKSTYIKGEMMGFSAYVINKDVKIPSTITKNLYCVITDSTDRIIASKLIKVDEGFANNIFKIDSLFTSGKYTFKAYTNWMNNFDEPNAFVEKFRVVDPDIEKAVINKKKDEGIDAQFLPEGGHFVDSVKTNVGVVIKNLEGFGVAFAQGDVFDADNKFITSFKTNELGIGKFLLYPFLNHKYIVKINHLDKVFQFKIDDIKPKGITIHVNESKERLILDFITNSSTLKDIKTKLFKLVVHNGKIAKLIDLQFDNTNLVKIINFQELLPGVNILTLFNENEQPILERIFFNFNGINFINSGKSQIIKSKDSLKINLPISGLKSFDIESNVSISVLPSDTKSYLKNQNIISYNYLQPYVKGYVENAAYYFTNITRQKKFELDNLLITQGWSSYDWGDIFKEPFYSNKFEEGINVVANVNGEKGTGFLAYPLKNNVSEIFELGESDKAYKQMKLFPEDDESYKVGLLKSNDRMKKPSLYIQFYPSKIPIFKPKSYTDIFVNESFYKVELAQSLNYNLYFTKATDVQELDQVLIEVKKQNARMESLKNKSFGNIDFFDDKKRRPGLTLAAYLRSRGYDTNDSNGFLSIIDPRPNSPNNPKPMVILDGVILNNFSFLANFSMQTVDYIEINRGGLGYGIRGGGGVIKIVTNPNLIRQKEGLNGVGEYKFPLTFSSKKKFYTPKYSNYNNVFFKEYGVIDWIPDAKIDNRGMLSFKIFNSGTKNIKFFIEGITSQGDIISEVKTVLVE